MVVGKMIDYLNDIGFQRDFCLGLFRIILIAACKQGLKKNMFYFVWCVVGGLVQLFVDFWVLSGKI